MSNPQMNKAKCTKCGDVVESKHLHDIAHCSCGNVSVVGGLINPMIRATDYAYLRSVEAGEDPIEAINKGASVEHEVKCDKRVLRDELLDRFDSRLATLHNLPHIARYSYSSVDELYSWLSEISTILRTL